MNKCNLVCTIRIRRWALPLLVISRVTRWRWLGRQCVELSVDLVKIEK